MTTATSQQIQTIQAICRGKFYNRDERLEFFSEFFFRTIKSTKDLSDNEAKDLITFLQTGKIEENSNYAKFNCDNKRHMKILSLSKELGWIEEKTGYADLERLGAWIKSKQCPVQDKTMKEMDHREISKVIKALESMVKSKWK